MCRTDARVRREEPGDAVDEAEPLARHRVFRTSDLDQAREEVARILCPHRLALCGRNQRLDTVQNAAMLHDVSLHYLDYGAEVRITPGELQSFFLVQMPLRGFADISCGGEHILSSTAVASVPAPDAHLDMRWRAGTPQLMVRIDRAALERVLWGLLGYEGSAPLRFDLGLDMRAATSATWRRAVRLLWEEAEEDGALFAEGAAAHELEHLVMVAILVGQRNNYSELLAAPCRPAAARVVRRAVELCERSPELPADVESLARTVGTSVRSLQEAFRRDLQTTPMRFVREVRLRRAHDVLVTAEPGTVTVSGVAADWGFTNLGRFSERYQARFGELPHETLRRPVVRRRR